MPQRPPKDPITERDLRIPEFRDCDIADLERRDDGTIARKDRWERGIREIAGILRNGDTLDPRKQFEVCDVVAAVRANADQTRRIVAYIKSAEEATRKRGENSKGRDRHDLASMTALAATLIEGIERGDHNAHAKGD